MEFKVNNLSEMCDAMCNNVVTKNKRPTYENKRECLSCKEFFDCKEKSAAKDGCIHYKER